jgi:hypothetical protein
MTAGKRLALITKAPGKPDALVMKTTEINEWIPPS